MQQKLIEKLSYWNKPNDRRMSNTAEAALKKIRLNWKILTVCISDLKKCLSYDSYSFVFILPKTSGEDMLENVLLIKGWKWEIILVGNGFIKLSMARITLKLGGLI